jgi:hypothetical protein
MLQNVRKNRAGSDPDEIIVNTSQPDLLRILHLPVTVRLGMDSLELVPSLMMVGSEQ